MDRTDSMRTTDDNLEFLLNQSLMEQGITYQYGDTPEKMTYEASVSRHPSQSGPRTDAGLAGVVCLWCRHDGCEHLA